jgi:lipooligosaccharide transport system permease protein
MSDGQERGRAPSLFTRLHAVWYRHYRVYFKNFIANATPAVLEPLFFQLAVGFGVGRYMETKFNGMEYGEFMTPGILGMTALYTASFEATHATYVRMQYQKTYDAMLATPLTRRDIFVGELLWCATKGFLYSAIVGVVLLLFGTIKSPWAVLIPVAGFFTAATFAGISFWVTSVVKNINQFQFYFTAFLTPLVYVSGLMFPVQELPYGLAWIAYSLPMFYVVETFRLIVSGPSHASVEWVWLCPIVLVTTSFVFGWLGVRAMEKRLKT